MPYVAGQLARSRYLVEVNSARETCEGNLRQCGFTSTGNVENWSFLGRTLKYGGPNGSRSRILMGRKKPSASTTAMFCPQCQAEYREGFARCSDCDIPLVDQL